MKGGEFLKQARRLLVKSILIPKMKKCEMSRIQIKNEDKNRFILIKEIVEKWKLSIFQKIT